MPKSEVYNCDCMTFMQGLKDNAFDLCIADPPYGIDIANNPFRQKFKKETWDDKAPDKDFFSELFRVSENQIIWGGNYFGLPPNKHFLIWDKVQPFDFSSSMCEYAWSSLNKPAKMFSYRTVAEKWKIHPTQKPIALYEWLIKNYAPQGGGNFRPYDGQSKQPHCGMANGV